MWISKKKHLSELREQRQNHELADLRDDIWELEDDIRELKEQIKNLEKKTK